MPALVERDGPVAILTFDRQEALNAFNEELLTDVRDRLRELAADPSVRVVVLTGAGERSFAAGADIKAMLEMDDAQAQAWGRLGHEATRLLETMPKPAIAAVNGFALGGGCEFALACDLRYASEKARFGQPEINLGIIPGWGGTQRLARIAGLGFARDLVYTGRIVDAQEALAHGLVNGVFPPEELLGKVVGIAKGLAEKSAAALAVAKLAVTSTDELGLEAGLLHEEQAFAGLFNTPDQREGMTAFVEKREPSFTSEPPGA